MRTHSTSYTNNDTNSDRRQPSTGHDPGASVGSSLSRRLASDVSRLMSAVSSRKRGGRIPAFPLGESFGGNAGGRSSMLSGSVVIRCSSDSASVSVPLSIPWGTSTRCEGDVGVGMLDGRDGSSSSVPEDLLLRMGRMEGGGLARALSSKERWGRTVGPAGKMRLGGLRPSDPRRRPSAEGDSRK